MSARHNEHVNNPWPISLHAAMVVNVPDEEIVYSKTDYGATKVKAPTKTSEPVCYPPEVAHNSPATKWIDRVALQRLRQSDICQYGHSNIVDQRIGFDEDTNPIDKDTTPCQVWDRQFHEYLNHSDSYNQNKNNTTCQNTQMGASGGNPGEPGGDSSDSGDNCRSQKSNKDPPKKRENKRRHSTPWDEDTLSNDQLSEYLEDSLFLDSDDSNHITD
ncbi:hypothetical protein L218DRAFT_998007 [Marasmius fiardii PR-910]|nr:hypothetical protein L218DRAFT_998007 [Marasmius fiardii PR-910]